MQLYTKPPQQFYPAPAGSEKNERIRVGSKNVEIRRVG